MSFFETLKEVPPDPIFGLGIAFSKDTRHFKVNLGVGTYCDADLKPHILNSVKIAEKKILERQTSKNYLNIEGDKIYLELATKLLLGQIPSDRMCAVQTIGGTGALSIGATLLKAVNIQQIALPTPTWGNHNQIFANTKLNLSNYPYFNEKSFTFDFQNTLQALEELPSGSAILLHGCCHNPSGIDPTTSEWKALLEVIRRKKLFPFFDLAYQGFGDGLEEDAAAIRLFANEGINFATALSFSKNFGLYSDRVGALIVACKNQRQAEIVLSHLKIFIRATYSNPSAHGSSIVKEILLEPKLKAEWEKEVKEMRMRINAMRQALLTELTSRAKNLPQNHPFIAMSRSKGMFAFTGLAQEKAEKLISEFGIYLLKNGRINLAGLNAQNIHYVADAMIAVSKGANEPIS